MIRNHFHPCLLNWSKGDIFDRGLTCFKVTDTIQKTNGSKPKIMDVYPKLAWNQSIKRCVMWTLIFRYPTLKFSEGYLFPTIRAPVSTNSHVLSPSLCFICIVRRMPYRRCQQWQCQLERLKHHTFEKLEKKPWPHNKKKRHGYTLPETNIAPKNGGFQ